MRTALTVGAAMAAALAGMAAFADSPMEPPMNNMNFAYYTCDNGGAFMMAYDANPPKVATMTTSNDNKRFSLNRTHVDKGVEFSGGGVTFWTDGKAVRVDGTTMAMTNCTIKTG